MFAWARPRETVITVTQARSETSTRGPRLWARTSFRRLRTLHIASSLHMLRTEGFSGPGPA